MSCKKTLGDTHTHDLGSRKNKELWGRRSYGNALRINLLGGKYFWVKMATSGWWDEGALGTLSDDDGLARSFGVMDNSVFVLRRIAGPGGSYDTLPGYNY